MFYVPFSLPKWVIRGMIWQVLSAHQEGHATTRFLEGFLEGSLKEVLLRRALRRALART